MLKVSSWKVLRMTHPANFQLRYYPHFKRFLLNMREAFTCCRKFHFYPQQTVTNRQDALDKCIFFKERQTLQALQSALTRCC